jgi:hypothetical protein
MSELVYTRRWFAERTDKELDECIQWMNSRHEVKDLERKLEEAMEELRDFAKEYSFEEQLKEK